MSVKERNVFMNKGMNTYMDQDKDRQQWSNAMQYRNELIQKLTAAGICPKRPHELKLKTLENLLCSAN